MQAIGVELSIRVTLKRNRNLMERHCIFIQHVGTGKRECKSMNFVAVDSEIESGDECGELCDPIDVLQRFNSGDHNWQVIQLGYAFALHCSFRVRGVIGMTDVTRIVPQPIKSAFRRDRLSDRGIVSKFSRNRRKRPAGPRGVRKRKQRDEQRSEADEERANAHHHRPKRNAVGEAPLVRLRHSRGPSSCHSLYPQR